MRPITDAAACCALAATGHAAEDGDALASFQFIANPHLFKDSAAIHAAIATWPLQPARVLNGA
jgi:hypothetical protein